MNPIKTTFLFGILTAASASAASIIASPGSPAGGAGYTYHLGLDPAANDTSSFQGTVGSWSWEDRSLGDGVFWRHQSDWLAVTLESPAELRLQIQRLDDTADAKLFPSFTIYRGFNDTTAGSHFASNTSDLQWEATSGLMEYITHHDNSSLAGLDESINLPAGDYTILLGGNAVSELLAENVNYSATLSAAPIPEPSVGLLGLIGALMFLKRRTR